MRKERAAFVAAHDMCGVVAPETLTLSKTHWLENTIDAVKN